jgi:hypothetical protein
MNQSFGLQLVQDVTEAFFDPRPRPAMTGLDGAHQIIQRLFAFEKSIFHQTLAGQKIEARPAVVVEKQTELFAAYLHPFV